MTTRVNKVSKTKRDAYQLASMLKKHFINVNGFEFKEISGFLKENNVNHNVFYYLVKAGYVNKIEYGIFAVNKSRMNSETLDSISSTTEMVGKKDRKSVVMLRRQRKVTKTIAEGIEQINFAKAVELIKSMGGKVLMPTSEYKEV